MTLLKNKYQIAAKAVEVGDALLKGETPEAPETLNNGTKDCLLYTSLAPVRRRSAIPWVRLQL